MIEGKATVGKRLLASLVDSPKGVKNLMDLGLFDELFSGGELHVYNFLNDHAMKYGTMPDRLTIEEELDVELPSVVEPPSYYLAKVESRYLHQQVKTTLKLAKDQINADAPEKALASITELVTKSYRSKNRKRIINFTDDAHKIIKLDYKNHLLLGDDYGIKLGYPYLDNMVGGLQAGDFAAIAGRPSAGKTYLMLHMAHHIWQVAKKVPLMISMEMATLPLVQRVAAMHSKISITKLKNAALSTKSWKKIDHDLSSLHEDNVPFWIVDGNLTATIDDVILLSHQFKPDIILIDGAYLLRAKYNNAQKWQQIAANAEAMKQEIASDLGIPVIASYQFNKDATRVKSAEDIGLEHIAGSEAIGQLSTVVLGLMERESIETMNRRHVSILKGRNGEVGGFNINWIFDTWPHMSFDEIIGDSEAELDFL